MIIFHESIKHLDLVSLSESVIPFELFGWFDASIISPPIIRTSEMESSRQSSSIINN